MLTHFRRQPLIFSTPPNTPYFFQLLAERGFHGFSTYAIFSRADTPQLASAMLAAILAPLLRRIRCRCRLWLLFAQRRCSLRCCRRCATLRFSGARMLSPASCLALFHIAMMMPAAAKSHTPLPPLISPRSATPCPISATADTLPPRQPDYAYAIIHAKLVSAGIYFYIFFYDTPVFH